MKRFPPILLAACLLAATALLAGCAVELVTPSAAEAPLPIAPGDANVPNEPAMPEMTTAGVDASTAQPFAERALTTLAEANVDPAAVTSIRVEAVEWPDAGLGCPQPGQMYAAVITPGYRIALDTDSNTYAVHTSSRLDGPFVLCEQE